MNRSLLRRNHDENSLESWLVSDDPAKQLLADETLARMGQDAATAYFIQTIKKEQQRRQTTGVWYFAGSMATFTALAVILSRFVHHDVNPGGFAGLFVYAGGLARPSRLGKVSISRLASYAAPHALPCLIDALTGSQSVEPVAAARGIVRSLPLLDSVSAAALTKKQWKALIARVNPSSKGKLSAEEHRELARAILLACARLEMGDALPQARKLAAGKATTPEAIGLQQTARNYLPLLEQAAGAQKLVAR